MAHGDLTGNTKAELTAQVAQDQAVKAQSMSMATAALESQKNDEPVDLVPAKPVDVDPEDGIQVLDVDDTERVREFKVNTTLENVTIGYGNTYSFEQGQKYKAPESVYNYLDAKGLVWH